MTALDLSPEAVAKMLEGVTPGPWIVEIDKRTWGWVDVTGPSINVGGPTRATDLNLADEVIRKADARFISWAREAVPALAARLAEVEVILEQMATNLDAFAKTNHRQARCLHLTAQHLGPDYSATIDALPKAAKHVAAELTRLRAKDYAADKLAEVYWRLRSYAVHDDDCTFNRHPHYRGCSCGLMDALDKGEAAIRTFQPPPAAPTEYEIKLARLKEDFPNGV